jgi:hypothetical protein
MATHKFYLTPNLSSSDPQHTHIHTHTKGILKMDVYLPFLVYIHKIKLQLFNLLQMIHLQKFKTQKYKTSNNDNFLPKKE